MKKKIISLMLIFAMLVPLSPAVAADEPSSQPTIEEILNGYHQKAFEAQTTQDPETASTWSRGSGSNKTLEQETVEELTAAGYEAYNVTGENYTSLETTLKTDFSEMGLDPDGSYIIVISGEENNTAAANSSRASDLLLPPHVENEGASNPYFLYDYNGTTHQMRYVTVSSATNSSLVKQDMAYLFNSFEYGDLEYMHSLFTNFLVSLLSYTVDIATHTQLGSIASIFFIGSDDVNLPDGAVFWIEAEARWTRTYTQIYEETTDVWLAWSSTDYVSIFTKICGEYFDIFENAEVSRTVTNTEFRYCEHYFDYEWRNHMAARGRKYSQATNEWIGDVYIFNPYPEYDDNGQIDILAYSPPIIVLPQSHITAP